MMSPDIPGAGLGVRKPGVPGNALTCLTEDQTWERVILWKVRMSEADATTLLQAYRYYLLTAFCTLIVLAP